MQAIVLLGAALMGLSAARGADSLVLHVPFDGSLGKPAEARDVALEAGRLGQAVRVKSGGTLSYDVAKRMEPRKGTLAFWVKAARDFGPKTALGRLIDVRSREAGYFGTSMRVSVKGKGDFTFQVFDTDAAAHGFSYAQGLRTWKANQWHHVAMVWHCLKGVRVYDDGREVFSSWGRDRWEPLTPLRLGLGCVPGRNAQADLWFDEARLYTEPLAPEQVAALAKGEDVRVARKAEKFPGILIGNPGARFRVETAGQPGLPELTLGKPLTIRQHLVKSAKVNKVTRGALADGTARGRPVSGPVAVEFRTLCRITHLAFDGPNVACRIGQAALPPGKHIRWAPKPSIEARRLRLDAHEGGPSLHEIRFHQVADGWLGEQGQRVPVAPATGPGVELLGPVAAADVAVAAASLDLKLAPPWPSLARIELAEEAERPRVLLSADVRIRGQGAMQVTLDCPDTILHKGARLVAAVLFDKPTHVAEGSSLVVHTTTLDTARDEYVTRQLGLFAAWYSVHAEAHRWDSKGWQPSSMPELRWLANARHVAPDHPLATAYHNRIFHHTRQVQVAIPGPPEAPMWAKAQREAMRRTADVVHWWIDNRQRPDGQFGGHWNDDVEMLHGWDLLVLGAGDEKVKRSMARLCEGIWAAGRFTRGYSNCIWDVEHAAEDSTYSQPRMVPLDYGNPKWLERCMATISNFDFWTEVNPKGHRHFKSYMFQAQKIRPLPETDSDVPDNARAAKIGLYVVWYNGNERVKQWFREWADAWVEDSFKPVAGKPLGVLPREIVSRTCQIGREGSTWDRCKRYPLGGLTYHMEDQLVGVYHFTRDPKYLGPIEAQIVHTRAAKATQVSWRRLTGSTKLDKRFVEGAKDGKVKHGFNAWLATGDKRFLEQACTETVRDFERTRFLVTEAEPPTDRVPLPGNILLREMMLGGIGVWVCGWPQMAVSWEGTGYDFAALVLESTPQRLKVLAHNFGPSRTVTMRIWELARGTYELRVGPDGNRDDAMDKAGVARRVAVDRATRIPIELMPNELTVIELRQLESRPAGKRPDLAISHEDVTLSADRKTVTVVVHNIGSAPAEGVLVLVEDAGGGDLGSGDIERILPPDDLEPKTVRLTIPLRRPASTQWRLIIDPESKLDEITRDNNRYQTPTPRAPR